MGVLEGLAIAVLVGGVLGCVVVLIIRDVRIEMRKARNPEHPLIEVLRPGEQPITNAPMTQQGGLYTVKCFGNLNDLPRLSGDVPKPPTSMERS